MLKARSTYTTSPSVQLSMYHLVTSSFSNFCTVKLLIIIIIIIQLLQPRRGIRMERPLYFHLLIEFSFGELEFVRLVRMIVGDISLNVNNAIVCRLVARPEEWS